MQSKIAVVLLLESKCVTQEFLKTQVHTNRISDFGAETLFEETFTFKQAPKGQIPMWSAEFLLTHFKT